MRALSNHVHSRRCEVTTVAIGSDHAGFELKESLRAWLGNAGYDVIDVGTHADERCDYPDFGSAVGRAVADGTADRGVAVCGSGIGICMAANKVPGVRGAVIRDEYDAEYSRRHNDANVACFGDRITAVPRAEELLQLWMETGFDGGRHEGRVEKLDHLTD